MRIPYGSLADILEATIGFENEGIRTAWREAGFDYWPAPRLPEKPAKELFWGLLAQAGIQYRLLLRIARLTWRVRVAQRAYFAAKKNKAPEEVQQAALREARSLEAALDEYLAELAGQAREAPPEAPRQAPLFERAP